MSTDTPDHPEQTLVGPPSRWWWRWLAVLAAGLATTAVIAAAVTWPRLAAPRTPTVVPDVQVTRTEFITPPTVTTTVSVTVLGLIPSSLLGGTK